MTYKAFRQLYDEISKYEDHFEYLQECGYANWMNEYSNPVDDHDPSRILEIAEYISVLTKMDINGLRKELGIDTLQEFSSLYSIPYRTLQDWGKNGGPVHYVKVLIAYTVFQNYCEKREC